MPPPIAPAHPNEKSFGWMGLIGGPLKRVVTPNTPIITPHIIQLKNHMHPRVYATWSRSAATSILRRFSVHTSHSLVTGSIRPL
jgi:hypothetical protein